MPVFHRITSGSVRGKDRWGAGYFGASRSGRSHRGLDVSAMPGESVLSPIDGIVIRDARPYKDDARYKGLVIQGSGDWAGYEVKMFYVARSLLGKVAAGDVVGTAQDLEPRYPGITNHVHLEVRCKGAVVDPAKLFGDGL